MCLLPSLSMHTSTASGTCEGFKPTGVLGAIKLDLAVKEAGGTIIFSPLPDPETWRREVDSFFPGCGTPVPRNGFPGFSFRCGGKLSGEKASSHFCVYCAADIAAGR